MYKEEITFNNNFRGGRPALTRVVSPYGRPVITGKPGILLAPPCFGFSRSPLPALCRRATSCAWRSRLRKIPDWRSGCRWGRDEMRFGWHPWATLAAQTVARRNHSGALGRPWWSEWPRRRSKMPDGIERRRAPNVTHSVVWRTCVRESI